MITMTRRLRFLSLLSLLSGFLGLTSSGFAQVTFDACALDQHDGKSGLGLQVFVLGCAPQPADANSRVFRISTATRCRRSST